MAKRTLKKHRTRTVKIAVTPEQHEKWAKAAHGVHQSLVAFCRESLDYAADAAIEFVAEREAKRKASPPPVRTKPLSPIEMMIDEACGLTK